METLDLYLQIREKYENPPKKLLFFAGYLQVKTQLDPDVIFDILSKIYNKNLSQELLEKVETSLINCNFEQLKELLCTDPIVICLLCNKSSGDLIYLECIHSFHRDCLTIYLTNSLESTINISCPVCALQITNISGVDPSIQSKLLTSLKRKLDVSSMNLVTCPYCGNIAEGIDNESPDKQNICYYCGKFISL